MSWKCFLGIHDLEYKTHRIHATYINEDNELPYERYTQILYQCKRCNKYFSKKIKGSFNNFKKGE